MKKITKIAIFAYAIYMSIPLMVSFIAEYQLSNSLKQLSEVDGVKLTLLKYDRGYSSSVAASMLEVSSNHSLYKDITSSNITNFEDSELLQFILVHHLKHGPYISSINAEDTFLSGFALGKIRTLIRHGSVNDYNIDDLLVKAYAEEIDKDVVGSIATKVGFLGEVDSILVTDNAEINLPHDKGFVKWKDIVGEFDTTLTFNSFTGSVSVGEFEIQNIDKLKITNLRAAEIKHKSHTKAWIGESNFTVDAIYSYDANTEIPTNVLNLKYNSSTTLAKDLVTKNMSVNLEAYKHSDNIYGPLSFDLTLERLDPAGLSFLQEVVSDSEKGVVSILNRDVRANIIDALPLLLINRPHLTLKTTINTDTDTSFNGFADVKMGGRKVFNLQKEPAALLNTADGFIKAEISKDKFHSVLSYFLKQHIRQESKDSEFEYDDDSLLNTEVDSLITDIVSRLVAANIIDSNSDTYLIDVEVYKGKLKLNDVYYSISEILDDKRPVEEFLSGKDNEVE